MGMDAASMGVRRWNLAEKNGCVGWFEGFRAEAEVAFVGWAARGLGQPVSTRESQGVRFMAGC